MKHTAGVAFKDCIVVSARTGRTLPSDKSGVFPTTYISAYNAHSWTRWILFLDDAIRRVTKAYQEALRALKALSSVKPATHSHVAMRCRCAISSCLVLVVDPAMPSIIG